MPSALLAATTDILVIVGAAALATAVLNPNEGPFRTSLGAEYQDDSPLAAETDDAIEMPEKQQLRLRRHADHDKKAPIVTVTEIDVTPPAAEMQGHDYFAGAKAA